MSDFFFWEAAFFYFPFFLLCFLKGFLASESPGLGYLIGSSSTSDPT